jgi:importin subunit alpha-6/7
VIDANIFPVLIDILSKAEFKTRKEAAWAITNATSGGSTEQIFYLSSQVCFFFVECERHFSLAHAIFQNCIPPLCDLLTVQDAKIVQVALNGLENILRMGEQDCKGNAVNYYAVLIEECYGRLLEGNVK